MPTEKQIRANKANARKSTGPRSKPGKAISSRNAMKHGLSAQKLLIEGEDPAMFDRMRDEIFFDMQPRGELQVELVEHIISTLWRLRRVAYFESAILSWISRTESQLTEDDQLLSSLHKDAPSELPMERWGRIMVAVFDSGSIDQLGRHEMQLQRKLERCLRQLQQLRSLECDARKSFPGRPGSPNVTELEAQ